MTNRRTVTEAKGHLHGSGTPPVMIMKMELLRRMITRIMAILLGMVTETLPAMIMKMELLHRTTPRIMAILLGMVTNSSQR